ncbi:MULTISPECIES: hypothetical protein [unclassified Paenibacillus]|uniref:hypothetical protein n=1 Tax=unclassified Paenibacillus TaxID=185978 RepID=UPI001AE7ECC9|nr:MULTISPECIES: hypothetical protein [unclassified Paenibacillus]MBP1156310.1 hypothetical protein [Paenibacillus sp. PvP091]MBP1168304.1 hypothetical protein [Paenibacillus sp. PvR098]MBP2439332.1 hypothetical protein [Paenibacillus sp. PvP052]
MKRKLGGKYPESARQDIPLQRRKQERLRKESRLKVNEEFAAEAAYPLNSSRSRLEGPKASVKSEAGQPYVAPSVSYRWLGYTALILAVLSLMMFPVLLGSSATLLGLFAFMLGQRALGTWSIAIGLISLAGYFVLVPLYT